MVVLRRRCDFSTNNCLNAQTNVDAQRLESSLAPRTPRRVISIKRRGVAWHARDKSPACHSLIRHAGA